MDTRPPKRGRPRGTGKDDTAYLTKVADMMVEDTTLKASSAMRRVIYATGNTYSLTEEATFLRRLQVKWKDQGAALLKAAASRRTQKSLAHVVTSVAHGVRYAELGLGKLLQSPEFLAAAERYNELALRTDRFLRQPEVMRALERMTRFQRVVQNHAILVKWDNLALNKLGIPG